MYDTQKNKNNNGVTSLLLILVFVVFLVLKLAEIGAVANWSWWAVTSPLWAPIILILALQIIAFLFMALFSKKKIGTASHVIEKHRENPIKFIEEIYAIEGKELPDLTNPETVRVLYKIESDKLYHQLMWMRTKPIPKEKLEKIKAMKYLPKACRFIFE